MTIDLGQLAREVELSEEQVQAVVELLDAGNTVPFIARFRKDQTGGLSDEQVRRIQHAAIERRNLAERKEAILRAIESQGKLSDELREKIQQTHSLRRLEDLFLPYKPKKQTLGGLAKDRGLEPLAREILHANPAAANLDARAADFVNPDRELNNPAEVLLGVGHFLAEHFSEHADARSQLRKTFWRTAKMICKPGEAVDELRDLDRQAQAEHEALKKSLEAQRHEAAPPAGAAAAPVPETGGAEAEAPPPPDSATPEAEQAITHAALEQSGAEEAPQAPAGEAGRTMEADAPGAQVADVHAQDGATPVVAPAGAAPEEDAAHENAAGEASAEAAETQTATDAAADFATPNEADAETELSPAAGNNAPAPAKPAKPAPAKGAARKQAKDQVKRRKRQKAVQTFRDFFDMREPIKNLSEPRVLSINRGERVRVLEVSIEPDAHAMQKQAEDLLVPADHPHGDFLRACARDAVTRLIVPSLVQEVRRELNDRAEMYAIRVFAENLRKLLLQKPIRGRRILAIEPGYRKGCKMAAVDEAGRVLGVGMLQVVGREDWRKKGRERLVEVIQKYSVTIVAVGDGPGSREVERMVTDVLEHELKDAGVEYTVVNEAGAATYGASPLAREELSKYDPSHRVAISIARRLLDPLAELVKVSPSNIEVGPAHYDIKTKILRDTLDGVVESVVSFVGVDVNRANPALLRYVAGMNQLTARRVYEYREHYGPLRNREQLKQIPGIDEKTYRQAAGFMKVTAGEEPLDATWIHPDNYDDARKVLDTLGLTIESVAPPAPKPKAFAEEVLAETAEIAPPAPEAPAAGEAPSAAGGATGVEAEASSEAAAPDRSTPAAEQAITQAALEQSGAEEWPQAPAGEAGVTMEADAPGAQVADVHAQSGATPVVAPAGEAAPASPEQTSTPPGETLGAGEGPGQPAPAAAVPAPSFAASGPEASTPAEEAGPAPAPYNEEVERRSADWSLDQKAQELGIGRFTLQHILTELARPGRDPREDQEAPALRSHRMSLDDVRPGMAMTGVVVSVVNFGAFVDIGLSESGLVHISRLANRYVRDAHDEVAVGDVIPVWVVEVDKGRGRVSLTAIEPGTEKPREERRERPKKEQKPQGRPEGRQSGQRPPGRQQRRDQGKKGSARPKQPSVYVVQSKKPAKPISKKMIEGKEPLRSFSDLQQFFQKKREDGEEEPKS